MLLARVCGFSPSWITRGVICTGTGPAARVCLHLAALAALPLVPANTSRQGSPDGGGICSASLIGCGLDGIRPARTLSAEPVRGLSRCRVRVCRLTGLPSGERSSLLHLVGVSQVAGPLLRLRAFAKLLKPCLVSGTRKRARPARTISGAAGMFGLALFKRGPVVYCGMTLDQVLAITGPLAEAAGWLARLLVLAGLVLLGHLLSRDRQDP